MRLYRPFAADAFVAALPATAERVAVLDRCKEPGSLGEPLFQDVITALAERGGTMPLVTGGRYGLASKEFTPGDGQGGARRARRPEPRRRFTVGIVDDVSHLSLPVDPSFTTEPDDVVRAVFYGLGADGTVGANKNSIAIIGEHAGGHAQGYFVYDSKKSGSVTVSHLRFGPRPIGSSYLIDRADFVACHQFGLLEKIAVLDVAAEGATFLLNAPYGPDDVWEHLPVAVQEQIVAKRLRLFVVDATHVAQEAGMGRRVNTVLQTCFFALSGVLPLEEAIVAIKEAIRRTYGKRGQAVRRPQRGRRRLGARRARGGHRAGHRSRSRDAGPRHRSPATASSPAPRRPCSPAAATRLPVSALPVDGTFPVGTARLEKRSIAEEIPIWDPSICIDCAKCAIVCPHAAIRMKVFPAEALEGAPEGFPSRTGATATCPA